MVGHPGSVVLSAGILSFWDVGNNAVGVLRYMKGGAQAAMKVRIPTKTLGFYIGDGVNIVSCVHGVLRGVAGLGGR